MGICGSCGMMVNGEPKLTCATFLASYSNGGKPIRVEPRRYFPVVRDLVVEMSDFMAKLKQAMPWLVRKQEKPLSEGEFLQTPEQLESYRQFSMCINCTLCYAACPVYGLDPVFVGPAAMALAQRYNLDSRDQGAARKLMSDFSTRCGRRLRPWLGSSLSASCCFTALRGLISPRMRWR